MADQDLPPATPAASAANEPTQTPANQSPTSEPNETPANQPPGSNVQVTPDIDHTRPQVLNKEAIEVRIYNQVGLVFKGEAKALASANTQGEFSILPGHTNFISLITQPVMLYPREGQPKKFEVGLGVLRCLYNTVEIYTGLLVSQESEAIAKELEDKPKPGLGRLGFLKRPFTK